MKNAVKLENEKLTVLKINLMATTKAALLHVLFKKIEIAKFPLNFTLKSQNNFSFSTRTDNLVA